MPYENPKQAAAIFLSIKRRQGLEAAKAFGRKHRDDLAKSAKSAVKRPYKARSK